MCTNTVGSELRFPQLLVLLLPVWDFSGKNMAGCAPPKNPDVFLLAIADFLFSPTIVVLPKAI